MAGSSGRLEFLLLWRDGRVTPGWAFCLVTFAWRALGALGAATTRYPDGILCEGPPYVVLKHPSRWRRDPWGFNFCHFLGVGCWALGARQGHPRAAKSATRSLYRDFNGLFGSPDRVHYDGTVIVAIGAL